MAETSTFERACQGGEAAACSLYGDARYLGNGGSKDARAAEVAYRRACELEHYAGCTKPGDLCSDYLSGYDVLSEPSLARTPCEIACAGGMPAMSGSDAQQPKIARDSLR